MLVSVIITTYQEGKYIERALRSIKEQTYKNIEIIITDSCSTDNTVKIARKYTKNIIIKKTNIPEGKNLGARHAHGDILVFIDADMIMEKRWIEKCLKHIAKNDAIVTNVKPLEMNFKSRLLMLFFRLFLEILSRNKNFGMGMLPLMIKKKDFVGFDERLTSCEDIAFIRKLNKSKKLFVEKNAYVLTSMRRFEKSGYMNWVLKWILNGFFFIVLKKPFYKDYYPVMR